MYFCTVGILESCVFFKFKKLTLKVSLRLALKYFISIRSVRGSGQLDRKASRVMLKLWVIRGCLLYQCFKLIFQNLCMHA